MKKRKTREERLIKLIEELEENIDQLSMTAYKRDALDYIFSELKDVLENGN